ncbi:hypothetical protein U0070_025004 [Myodes glareolus]|uniref:Uncharacterized protein n=1 Tax=Myodes glareolus TaxID=447135 RepID=A0AAW0I032_MYOGA
MLATLVPPPFASSCPMGLLWDPILGTVMPGGMWTQELVLLRGFSMEAEWLSLKQAGLCGSDVGVFLDLLLEGSYETMFLHSVTQNILNSTTVAEEKIDSYLEKQIVNFLDCATDLEEIER